MSMIDRHTIALVAAIAAAGVMISGAILRFERSGKLQDEVQVLRVENAKLEALLDQALKMLHHERLMHFGEENLKEGYKPCDVCSPQK